MACSVNIDCTVNTVDIGLETHVPVSTLKFLESVVGLHVLTCTTEIAFHEDVVS